MYIGRIKEFDLRDTQGGYSGGRIYSDEDIYVSLASENAYNRGRLVIDVTFNKLGIEVITFDLVDLARDLRKDVNKKQEFMEAVFKLISLDYDTLNKIAENSYKEGFRQGQEELKSAFRTFIGVEE